MKPKLKGDYVHCLAMFKPVNISEEEWALLDGSDLGEVAQWSAFRVLPEAVYAYNRSSVPHAVTIWVERGSITVSGKIEDWDEILNYDSERIN